MTTLDIINLIEKNPITKLSTSYNNNLLKKIKENFTETQQQIYISSLYCYLNHDQRNDYVIDLDKIWEWLGFYQKLKAKVLLEKNFTEDKDYKKFAPPSGGAKTEQNDKCLLTLQGEQKKEGRGGHNKNKYMLNLKCFKALCLKAGTKKADEIHEYYIKLEEMLHDVVQEESDELRLQLMKKDKQIEDAEVANMKEKEILVEKTLVSQFPVNTQCIYYGKIDNKSGGKENSKMYHEDLIKFGQSNNLGERIKSHKKNFMNFRLIGAFKVKNKIEIENTIKRHPILKQRIRSLTTIENPNFKEETYRELLALDDDEFTIENIHDHFKQIIKESEYNIENYNLLLTKKDELENKIRELENTIKELKVENEKMHTEWVKFQPDITTTIQKKIASNYTLCKYSYYLYAFECENMRYKCSITRQKDYELLETNLKNIDKNGSMKYRVKVNYAFSEKIMMFLLKQNFTLLGNNKFEGAFSDIKQILDITVKLENILDESGKDLQKLYDFLYNANNTNNPNNQTLDPETPIVRKAKRSIDQINKDTNEIINTYESIEAAGRALGLTTGTAIGIALREKRICKGFLWRYTGISKEDQYNEQPVIKICCNTGDKTYFKTIADAARDANISAPALRQRIFTNVHLNNSHWIFNKPDHNI